MLDVSDHENICISRSQIWALAAEPAIERGRFHDGPPHAKQTNPNTIESKKNLATALKLIDPIYIGEARAAKRSAQAKILPSKFGRATRRARGRV